VNIYLLAFIGLLTTALAILGWRYDIKTKQLDLANAKLAQVQSNGKTEIKYVETIKTVAGPERIRTIVEHGLCDDSSLHSESKPDAATGTNAPDRLHNEGGEFAGELSKELASVARNQAQLDALHDELGPQVK
jgi:hypothetical protein